MTIYNPRERAELLAYRHALCKIALLNTQGSKVGKYAKEQAQAALMLFETDAEDWADISGLRPKP
jgi:hypothetical protein